HKKTPYVFELIRRKCNRITSVPNELTLMLNNLPSGYHRELQHTKEILFPAISTLKDCMDMAMLMLENISVKENILEDETYKYLFTVEAVNDLVNKGVPFRDAYREIGNLVDQGKFSYDAGQLRHTHEGSLGNLRNDLIVEEMERMMKMFM